MTLNQPDSVRIRELCSQIAEEQDRHKFQELVEELNIILEGQERARTDDNGSVTSSGSLGNKPS